VKANKGQANRAVAGVTTADGLYIGSVLNGIPLNTSILLSQVTVVSPTQFDHPGSRLQI